MKKAYDSPEYQDYLKQRGYGLRWAAPKEFAAFMAKTDAELGAVMRNVGLVK